jgi:hypothetical protein
VSKKRLGAALIAIGIAGILWGVFHVLAATQPPPGAPLRRQTYDEVKPRVHRSFAGGLVRALAGLGVALIGGRVLRGATETSA